MIKNKVIFDTNIWISYLLTNSFTKIDNLLLNEKIEIVFSTELFNEFLEVANRSKLKKYFDSETLDALINLISNFANFYDVSSDLKICRDKKDDFLLNLAIDSEADYLITGDQDLLVIKTINKTKIIRYNDFIEEIT